MKNIILITLFLLCQQWSFGQENAINKYFEKYSENENFTSVFISEYMFSLFADVNPEDPEDKEVMEILQGLKSLQVLTTEDDGLKYYEEAIKMIDTKEYKVLMKVRDEGSKVQFLIKKEGKEIVELLLLVGDEEEFVLLSIMGNIALDKISKLAKHMDIDGLEHLDKVDEN